MSLLHLLVGTPAPFRAYTAWRESGVALSDVMHLISYWLVDAQSRRHVFALHNLVAAGERYGNSAGEWIGPNDACQALR